MAVEYRDRATRKLEEGKSYFEKHYWSESVSSFQEAIELFTKSAFLCLGVQPPRKHKISAEEFVRLQTKLPKELEKIRLAKVYLVSELWSQVYLLAKYGNEVLKVGPSEFFGREEAALAMDHAGLADVFSDIVNWKTEPEGDKDARTQTSP
jgi:HEPN domain-containing protein